MSLNPNAEENTDHLECQRCRELEEALERIEEAVERLKQEVINLQLTCTAQDASLNLAQMLLNVHRPGREHHQ